jgi:hypothetical protein
VQFNLVLIHLKEMNLNSASHRILASNDDVTYETIKAAVYRRLKGKSAATPAS